MKFLSAAKGRWITAATLLVLSVVAAPAMAQSCNGFANSLTVDRASQIAQEFDDGNNYGPVTVTLTIKNATSLPSGASLAWTQTGSPAVTLNTSNPLRPTFVAPSVGADGATLNFSVQARCNGIVTGNPALASVTIQNVDRPPVVTALASPAIADTGQVVSLDATGSDPDGDSIAYTWTQVGTPSVTLSHPGAASTTFVAPTVPVAVTLQFRVEARAGTLARTASVTVTVTAANLPPFAALSCAPTVDEGTLFRLDGTGSYDPEGAPLTYEWFVKEIDAGLAFSLDGESGNYVDRVAPSLGLRMAGGVEVRLRVSESPTVFTDATCAFMILDGTRPVLDLPTDLLLDADSAFGTEVQSYDVSAYDNVDGDLSFKVACDPSAPHLFPLGENTVSCAVEDSAGNGATGSFNIKIQDLSPPVFVQPSDVAMEGDTLGGRESLTYALPTASDKVDAAVEVSCKPPSDSFFAIGSTTVKCTATDAANNGAEVSFTATVHDTQPPLLTLPAIPNVEATSSGGAIVSFEATALDIVDGVVTVSCTPASPHTFALGTTMVNCSANDKAIRPDYPSGNVASGSFSVTVVDTTPPVIAPRGDIPVEATGPSGAAVSYARPATADIVDGAGTATCNPVPGSTFGLGETTVTCIATDAAGNDATPTSFKVRVVDTLAPVVTAPLDVTREATGPRTVVAHGTATATDVVGVTSQSNNAPADFPLGTTTITWYATDAAGNTGSATSRVTVIDTAGPAFASYPAVINATASGNAQAAVSFALPTATDLVDGPVAVACDRASGSSFPAGSTTVNCSARDGRSPANVSTMSFRVQVDFNWTGFFRPVDNWPVINLVQAGSAIPVKFNLGGNQGLAIFEAGSPASGQVACTAGYTEEITLSETVTAGGSSLHYDASSGQYNYVWKTEKSWGSTCRILQLKLKDGSVQKAVFQFKK